MNGMDSPSACRETLAAATVTRPDGPSFVVASMYGAWENMHRSTGSRWIYADGSVHRLISDLSRLIGHATRHRIVAAGDLNVLYGYGEYGNAYAAARYATVFDRMESLGLPFVGPRHPHGRQADPWPDELPEDSRNVPTFHHSQQSPSDGNAATGLRIRLREHGWIGAGAGAERSG